MVATPNMNIEEFFNEFHQNLHAQAGAGGDFIRSKFVEHMCSLIEADGFIPSFSQTDYKHTTRGLAVDAWAYDDQFSKLTLFVTDFRDSGKLETLTQSEVTDSFKRLARFLDACLKKDFPSSLDESMPVTELAWFFAKSNGDIKSLSLVILSNARLSSRVMKLPGKSVAGRPATYEIWDLERIHRIETSGKEREDIEIDFSEYAKQGIPCLPAYMSDASMKSYLLVMPGPILADLYEKYGERLLEQNVRTFLQFRGNINKGMRNTILNEPHMFFSYNNGLSATAEEVRMGANDTRLLAARNLQIVNGGQTTASIFTAGKKEKGKDGKEGVDLSGVYVQVKLSVVSPELTEEVVPRISEYANTQNKVSAADFFSNHPFHRKMEEFSRRLWAPSPVGMVQQTHWFYERARGQYVNKQANLTPAEKKKFLLQNPKNQMFTKTDLAKYVRSFEGLPHEVSKGAQKNFSGFAGDLGRQWDENDGHDFNELWFKRLIGQAIYFRHLDNMVLRASWYTGYKANVVAYALAKFADLVKERGVFINFLKIWEMQTLPECLANSLLEIAESVNTLLLSPPASATSNVSEWAKSESCWASVRAEKMLLQEGVDEYLMELEQNRELEQDAGRTDTIQEGIHAQTYVFEKGADYWKLLREWNNANRKLTAKEVGILDAACAIPNRIPSEKQSHILIAAENRAKTEGFFPG
jgi:AIPR protein/Abortive infection phage resistance protein N-terminal domain